MSVSTADFAARNQVWLNSDFVRADNATKNKIEWIGRPGEQTYFPDPYTFADVSVTIMLPFSSGTKPPMVSLPGLTILSLSEHRETYPVVGLGRKGIKGYTTGHYLPAGSMGFVVQDENPFAEVIRAYASWAGLGAPEYITPDNLPPFDISVVFFSGIKSEIGSILIKSVKIVDTSKNISVNDIQLTDMYSFMASQITTLMRETYKKEYNLLSTMKDANGNFFTDAVNGNDVAQRLETIRSITTFPVTTFSTTTTATTTVTTTATTTATTASTTATTASTTVATTTAATTTAATTTATTTAVTTTVTTTATTTAATTTITTDATTDGHGSTTQPVTTAPP